MGVDKMITAIEREQRLRTAMDDAAKEIARLTLENWQLKGALGNEVPGNIPPGPFKCGLCEAKQGEIVYLTDELTQDRNRR